MRSSQYDGSDTISVTSSEEDQWGPQIGAYNENGAAYPPPPVALVRHHDIEGPNVGAADLEAMLEAGFDDRPSSGGRPPPMGNAARYTLNDPGPYAPLARSTSPNTLTSGTPQKLMSPVTPTGLGPPDGVSSALGGAQPYKTHMKKRSGGRGGGSGGSGGSGYGPLGPLDPKNNRF